jgi:solute carrier family 25 phosphate transporter 3
MDTLVTAIAIAIGLLACGVTHALMTPIDVVKTNAQVNKQVFPSATAGMRSIYSGSVCVQYQRSL